MAARVLASIVALRAATDLVVLAIDVALTLDAEAQARVTDGIVPVTFAAGYAGPSAFAEHGTASFARVVAVTVGQTLDAAACGITERLVRVAVGQISTFHASAGGLTVLRVFRTIVVSLASAARAGRIIAHRLLSAARQLVSTAPHASAGRSPADLVRSAVEVFEALDTATRRDVAVRSARAALGIAATTLCGQARRSGDDVARHITAGHHPAVADHRDPERKASEQPALFHGPPHPPRGKPTSKESPSAPKKRPKLATSRSSKRKSGRGAMMPASRVARSRSPSESRRAAQSSPW